VFTFSIHNDAQRQSDRELHTGEAGNVPCDVILSRVRATIDAMEKQQVLHIVRVCVFVGLSIQHAVRMRSVIFPSVSCPDLS